MPTSTIPTTPIDAEIAALAPSERGFLLGASLVRRFRPERLVPLDASTLKPMQAGTVDRRAGLAYVVGNSVPVHLDDPTRFSCALDDDLRRRALDSFGGLDRIRRALMNLPTGMQDESEPLRVFFEVTPSPTPSLDELSDRRQALVWLGSYFDSDDALTQLDRQIERVGLLAPLQRLAGDDFVGRTQELNALRRFVGVLSEMPPSDEEATTTFVRKLGAAVGSAIGSVVDWATNLIGSRDILLVTAPGGMGKSTLLAKLVLDHGPGAPTDRQCAFVLLDFDRPSLISRDPRVLLEELGRQIEVQIDARIARPWARAEGAEATDQAMQTIEASDVDRAYFLEKQVAEYAGSIASVLSSSPFAGCPLLLIFDTLERVFRRGRHWVAALDSLIGVLRSAGVDLRVITAGRALLAEVGPLGTRSLSWREQPLHALSPAAAVQLLVRRGLTRDQARRVAEEIGGVPLSLRLAADYLKKQKEQNNQNNPNALLDATTTRSWLGKRRLSDAVIQGNLYQRLLTHIDKPQVQQLAYPGLVLREVTPTLIKDVLAEPCGLGPLDKQSAKALFDALAQEFTLVDDAGRDRLKHRNDVRQVMLGQMLDKDSERAAAISRAAVRYYDRLKGPRNIAEALYHRMLLGADPQEIESRWVQGVEDYLGEQVIDEIPSIPLRVYLANKLRLEVDHAEWLAHADRQTMERRIEQDFQGRLRLGQVREALELVASTPEFSAGSPLYPLVAQAHADVREYDTAMRWVNAGLERLDNEGAPRSTLLHLYLVRARIFESSFRPSPRMVSEEVELLDALWREHPGDARVAVIALLELEILQEKRVAGTCELQRWLEAHIAAVRADAIDPALAARMLPAFMLDDEYRSVALARWLLDLPGVTAALARILQRFASRSQTFVELPAAVLHAKLALSVPSAPARTRGAGARAVDAVSLSVEEITAIALAVRRSAQETRAELRRAAR